MFVTILSYLEVQLAGVVQEAAAQANGDIGQRALGGRHLRAGRCTIW